MDFLNEFHSSSSFFLMKFGIRLEFEKKKKKRKEEVSSKSDSADFA